MMKPNQGLSEKAEMIAVISARIQIHRPRERGAAATGIAKRIDVIRVEKSHKVIQLDEIVKILISRYK